MWSYILSAMKRQWHKRVQSYKTKEYLSGTVIDILGEELKKLYLEWKQIGLVN